MEKETINRIIAEHTGLKGDFVSDLNAMHEAETHLLPVEVYYYADKVINSEIPGDGTVEHWNLWDEYGWFGLLKATAAQRAEAFLRAKGLWK